MNTISFFLEFDAILLTFEGERREKGGKEEGEKKSTVWQRMEQV